MFLWLALAALVAVGIAEPEVDPAAARNPISIQYDNNNYVYEDHDRSHDRDGRHRDDDHVGPNIIHDPIAQGPHNSRQNNKSDEAVEEHIYRKNNFTVIMNAYSPDYYQPTWILDYRYQKTGGRDYTRADGGQILILPKNVHSNEQKIHGTFDELLEFLRLNNLAESEAHRLHPEDRNSHGDGYVRPESYGQQWQKDQPSWNAHKNVY